MAENQIKLIGLEQLTWFYEEKIIKDQDNITNFLFSIFNNSNNITSKNINLLLNDWIDDAQTIQVDNITNTSKVLVKPNECGIKCQTISNNSLTFKYKIKPNSNISIDILILN